MAGKTFKVRAIVLRKTKLGEKDLIVTMIDQTGCLVKAVAKGARKPGGSLAAKIELFSTVDALVAQGKSLGILSEVRLVTDGSVHEFGLEQTACAAPVAELLCLVAQEGLEQERLFEMSRTAFLHLRAADETTAVPLCAAALWKIMAQSGFRPWFDACASCGAPVDDGSPNVRFSPLDGGTVCPDCAPRVEAALIDRQTIGWCRYFLNNRFADIASVACDPRMAFSSLELAREWVRVHLGRNLKSLDFVFSSGLF